MPNHDLFICHASEDKDAFVRPLAEHLRREGLRVWYDEFSLTVGDRLRQKIDEGIATSDYGVVVLSAHFFNKGWTNWELDGFLTRHLSDNRKILLPIWHEIGFDEVSQYSPSLANVVALRSHAGVSVIADQLLDAIGKKKIP